ncbi:hypothetical protein ACFQZF_08420 [Flavobacterium myungsuense]|uniref:Uncharacterized protein n=1 Tax=Flavobacterium myungsuense TaxID=651823 RepID=A0ABW3J4C7_9FLAO
MQKSYQANAPRHENKIDEMNRQKKGLQLTGVLRNWGFCTKFEHWNSNQHLC